MRPRSCLLALASALLAGPALAASEPARCQMQQLAELPVDVSGGNVTIEAEINGQPTRMIIDTGSMGTVLFHGTVQKLGLAPGRLDELKSYGVGGEQQDFVVRVKEFKVANLIARNQDMDVSGNLTGAAGLLGALFLLQADVEFDFPEGKIRFFKPVNCAGDQVVYWGAAYSVAPMLGAVNHGIKVNVQLNGAPVVAEMDTGAPFSVVTLAAAARAGVTPKSEGVASSTNIRGLGPQAVQAFIGVFPSFSFGDETIKNAKLQIADLFHANKETVLGSHMAVSTVEEPNMLLGADFFRSHRVYVAREQRKVYVSYMGGPVFQTIGVHPAAPAETSAPK
jgi:predicted aspartyl protease